MKKIVITTLLLLFSNLSIAKTEIESSKIDFTAIGNPSFIKATGSLNFSEADLKIENNQISGSIIVNLNKLDTDIELRDKHLKEKYLETDKFPIAKLTLNPFKIEEAKPAKQKIKAILDFHGVKKEMQLELDLKKIQSELSVEGEFSLKLSDHNIELPSFQGITAADIVKLKVFAKFKL